MDDFERRRELRRQKREEMRQEVERVTYQRNDDDEEEAARERRRRARLERQRLNKDDVEGHEVNSSNSITGEETRSTSVTNADISVDDEAALLDRLAKREERRQKRLKEALERQKEFDPTISVTTDETITISKSTRYGEDQDQDQENDTAPKVNDSETHRGQHEIEETEIVDKSFEKNDRKEEVEHVETDQAEAEQDVQNEAPEEPLIEENQVEVTFQIKNIEISRLKTDGEVRIEAVLTRQENDEEHAVREVEEHSEAEERERIEEQAKREAEERERVEAEKREAEERERLKEEAKREAAEKKAAEERERLEKEERERAEAERKAAEERERIEAELREKAEAKERERQRRQDEERKAAEEKAAAERRAQEQLRAEEERKKLEAEEKRKAEEKKASEERERKKAAEEKARLEALKKNEAEEKKDKKIDDKQVKGKKVEEKIQPAFLRKQGEDKENKFGAKKDKDEKVRAGSKKEEVKDEKPIKDKGPKEELKPSWERKKGFPESKAQNGESLHEVTPGKLKHLDKFGGTKGQPSTDEADSKVEAGKKLDDLRRRKGDTESGDIEKLKQKQQEASVELEELKKRREERKKIMEEEEKRKKQEEAERKAKEEEEKKRLKEEIERRRAEAAEKRQKLPEDGLSEDKKFKTFTPKSSPFKPPELNTVFQIEERAEFLHKSAQKSVKSTQPAVVSKIDSRLEQYTSAIGSNKGIKTGKAVPADLPLASDGVRNIKSMWEKGNVFSSPGGVTSPNKETAGLKVGVSSRINEWLTKTPETNKTPFSKPSDLRPGDVSGKRNLWEKPQTEKPGSPAKVTIGGKKSDTNGLRFEKEP